MKPGPLHIPGVSRAIGRLAAAGVLAAATTLAAPPALAHEPLWGETPTIFGPGVIHPELRFGYLRRGETSDPGDERQEQFEQMAAVQYGINRYVNVRMTLPGMRSTFEENIGGQVEDTLVAGGGDLLLDAKWRYHLHQELGLQRSQALVVGWKLPTGDDDRAGPDGVRLDPSLQPGSGRHGVEIGWAIDRERLIDTWWACAFYDHDFGDGFRKGDSGEITAAYGRWLVRPNSADEFGFNLAAGIRAEVAGSDTLEDGASAGNDWRLAGVHVTPIFTKGRAQYRIGVFVPLVRSGDDEMTDFPWEVRAGWEMFF
ncbi:MAG TPA: hypothetical protein VFC25_12635 [Verrucomicrobiae bacterium]|nr:hypothetical protein [Verrucomicrobiae bacterium]